MMRNFLTEDEVRDIARDALNLYDSADAKSGVGQLTKFNKLGFKGNNQMGGICQMTYFIQQSFLKRRIRTKNLIKKKP